MTVELEYFDITGLGEPIRVMLQYGNIPFVDKRVKKDEWVTLKPEMAFGQMPRLKIDGLELYQSRAICRYIASKLNLRGNDLKTAALTDMWVDNFDDMRGKVASQFYQIDSDERTDKLKELTTTIIPAILKNYESCLEKSGSKFFVGDEVTWADVMFFAYMLYIGELLNSTRDDLVRSFPHLSAICKTIGDSTGVRNWLKVKPVPTDPRSLFM